MTVRKCVTAGQKNDNAHETTGQHCLPGDMTGRGMTGRDCVTADQKIDDSAHCRHLSPREMNGRDMTAIAVQRYKAGPDLFQSPQWLPWHSEYNHGQCCGPRRTLSIVMFGLSPREQAPGCWCSVPIPEGRQTERDDNPRPIYCTHWCCYQSLGLLLFSSAPHDDCPWAY